MQKYADLEIRILEKGKEGYPVDLTLDGEREFPRGYLAPDFLPWVSELDPGKDGQRLFNWFTADAHIQAAWAEVRGLAPMHRVRLRIDETAPELHALPWELLRRQDGGETAMFLAAADATPFSRYLSGRWQPGSPILKRPIKILVAMANPDNLEADYELEAVQIEDEWEALQEVVDGLEVELSLLPQPCSLPAVEESLREGVHILHFIGHGQYSRERDRAVLYMADAENQVSLVSEIEFSEMLARLLGETDSLVGDKLRQVFLVSCQTATRSPAEAFRGFAPRLVQAGVPAVLAMQDLIPVDTARAFSRTYYTRLLEHGLADLAANQARAAVLTAELPGGGVPVLFMRLRRGRLLGQRGQMLGDRTGSFWSTLLRNIADGECTPFLGSGVTAELLPSPQELAQTLAQDFNFPFTQLTSLARVSQFIGTLDNRRLRKDVVRSLADGFARRMGLPREREASKATLSETIAAADWSARSREIFETEIHHQLADLDLPLYITTNFDNFMALALAARGRQPRRETVPWRPGPAAGPEEDSHYELHPAPSTEEPVVMHLFGTDEDLLSMVLTEDDHLDYLARLSRDHEYLLPTNVNEALASTTLLFVGYRLDDLDLKVILRGLLSNLDLARWGMLHVAVQIEAVPEDEGQQEEVVRYFQKYFSDLNIDVYWGSTQQFVSDLHARWLEHRDG